MGFLKVLKTKAYFKKFQTKKRRRREGKTDFRARRGLCKQAKNKYNMAKYRLIVRFTNRHVICQIAYATIQGDKIVCGANSHELPRYGIPCGLKNFGAAYATGLLVARRMLKSLNLEESFEGVEECDGEDFHIEDEVDDDDRRPFKAILDIGLKRTVVGSKVFAAMKGAADGGLHVPHSNKRFPGYSAPENKGDDAEFNAEELRDRIFGSHVTDYMETMEEEDEQKYQSHFKNYIDNDVAADGIEDMYTEAHKKIRADPALKPSNKKVTKHVVFGNKTSNGDAKWTRPRRLTKKQKFNRVQTMISNAQRKILAAAAEEDDDE